MIGRTNAGGGAQKYLAGSFTSTQTTSQKTFTVAGLDFEPKLLIIRRISYVNVINWPKIVGIAFKDFEHDICYGINTSISSGYYIGGSYHPSSVTITLSKSDDVTTVTLDQPLSGNSSEDAYGGYNYYFYG